MNEKEKSKEVLVSYFSALQKDDLDTAVSAFQEDVVMISTIQDGVLPSAATGTYYGKQAVHGFLTQLHALYERVAFTIEKFIGNAEAFFANGDFVLKARSTGALEKRNWAVYIEAENGKIKRYQFYEEIASSRGIE